MIFHQSLDHSDHSGHDHHQLKLDQSKANSFLKRSRVSRSPGLLEECREGCSTEEIVEVL